MKDKKDICILILLFIILFIIFGSLVYLCVYGRNKMEDSKKLVMTIDAVVTNNSTSYETCRRRERNKRRETICVTRFKTPLNYTFNNQTKNTIYDSTKYYLKDQNIAISISKETGNPMEYQQTKLYIEGDDTLVGGIIGCCIFGSAIIYLCRFTLVYCIRRRVQHEIQIY